MATCVIVSKYRGQWEISLGGQTLGDLGYHVKETAFQSVFSEELYMNFL